MKEWLMNQCLAAVWRPRADQALAGCRAVRPSLRQVDAMLQWVATMLVLCLACAGQAQAQAAPAPPAAAASAADLPLLRLFVRERFFEGMTDACSKRYAGQSATYSEQLNAWKLKHEATRKMAAKRYLSSTQQNDRAAMNEALSVERSTIERWQTDEMKVPKDRAPTQGECDRLVVGMGQLALPGAVKAP
jgi:hypothetical protein